MPLDAETIKRLQALKNKPKRRGGKAKGGVDTSVRDVATWFKLQHRFYDYETEELLICENPNCLDPRPPEKRGRMMVEIDGTHMCRYCFLAEFAAPANNPAQEELEDTG